MPTKPYVGGQAVIEGVLMRSPSSACAVVRRPDGQLALQLWAPDWKIKGKLRRLFALRGVATLVESLALGYRALQFSAEQQDPEIDNPNRKDDSRAAIWISIVLAIGLFVAAPQGLVVLVSHYLNLDLDVHTFAFHAWVGLAKLGILLAYLWLISRIPDVQRVFQYHGAEHKTIYAYEKGLALTVENARKQSTLHPRCGTTFLIMVVAISVVLGALVVPVLVPRNLGWGTQPLTFLIRLALLPAIAALAYELQRFSARYCSEGPFRFLLWPGFLVQKITTREPDDAQLETAIAAMQASIAYDLRSRESGPFETPRFFAGLSALLSQLPQANTAQA